MKNPIPYLLSLLVLTLISIGSIAQPISIVDSTPGTATNDGTVNPGEYVGVSSGINNGFGDIIGATSQLHIDSDLNGNLNLGLQTGLGPLNDVAVIYIESKAGGFSDLTSFSDNGDRGRASISGIGHNNGGSCTGGAGQANIEFATGFEADYAITIESGFASLFELKTGPDHTVINSVNLMTSGTNYEIDLLLADIGLSPGDSFDYVVTYGNPCDGAGFFRSDEFHGVEGSNLVAGNVGVNPVTLAAGDFNTFQSVCSVLSVTATVTADETCTGFEDGAVSVSVSFTGPSIDLEGSLSFLPPGTWISLGTHTSSPFVFPIDDLPTGTFSISIRDASNTACVMTDDFTISLLSPPPIDADGDFITICGGDCDDDPSDDPLGGPFAIDINPNATEVCDGVDNDCDGEVDEEGGPLWYVDTDNDGYGDNDDAGTSSCFSISGSVTNNDDCDDTDSSINPDGTEICDGKDNDCDGSFDEGFDLDGDGVTSCGGDCDDNNNAVYPGNTELMCDGLDNDCSSATPDNNSPATVNITTEAGIGEVTQLTVGVDYIAGVDFDFNALGPGVSEDGGQTWQYQNMDPSDCGGLWWSFFEIENPRHQTQPSFTGYMEFTDYDPATGIALWTSTVPMMIPLAPSGTAVTNTQFRMQLQPYGAGPGPLPLLSLPPIPGNTVLAGDIGLPALPSQQPLIDVKVNGDFQAWFRFEVAGGGQALAPYYNSLHTISGQEFTTSASASFYKADLECDAPGTQVTLSAVENLPDVPGPFTYIFNGISNSTGVFPSMPPGLFPWEVIADDGCLTQGVFEVLTATDTEAPTLAFCESSNASSYTGATWNTGSNDGQGFGSWTVQGSNGPWGSGVISSTNNGSGIDTNGDGDINTSGRAHSLLAFTGPASSHGLAEAFRDFNTPMGPGSTFIMEMDNGYIDGPGTNPAGVVGMALQNANGDNLLEFFFIGGQPNYTLKSGDGENLTTIPFTDEGVRIEIRQLDLVSCQPIVVDLASGSVYDLGIVPFIDPNPNPIEATRFRLFNFNAGNLSSGSYQQFFNNFEICHPGCPDDILVNCNEQYDLGITGAPLAFDNCDLTPVVSYSDVVVTGGGTTTITRTWIATDAAVNESAPCDQIITFTDTEPPTFAPAVIIPPGVINFGDMVVTCSSVFESNADPNTNAYVLGTVPIQDWEADATLGQNYTDAVNNVYHGPAGNEWTKDNMGEVFGVTFDIDGNIYATATCIYGPAGFTSSAEAGAIYKIDQVTGIPSLLVSLPNEQGILQASNNGGGGPAMIDVTRYPSLGNISYDVQHDQLLVTNFEDGKIYRISTGGVILESFDPMGADDGTPGIAPRGERVWGINSWGTDPSSVQVLYSVWAEDRGVQGTGVNSMRSIFLNTDGSFNTATDMPEFNFPDISFDVYSSPTSDLIVSHDGLRLIAAQRTQRGDTRVQLLTDNQSAHRARILEYTRASVGSPWLASPQEKYATGTFQISGNVPANSSGGIDWGYTTVDPLTGATNEPESHIWTSVDWMFTGGLAYYGVQGVPEEGNTPFNESVIIGLASNPGDTKANFGDVEVLQRFPGQTSDCQNLIVSADPGQCGANVFYNIGALDNCPGVTVTCDPASNSLFPIGVTTVTCTATDAMGLQATCMFTVTVTSTGPTGCCPPTSLSALPTDESCPSAADGSVIVTATGGIGTFTYLLESVPPGVSVGPQPTGDFTSLAAGDYTITVIVDDDTDCTATVTTTVGAEPDTEAPTITCPESIIVNNDEGMCGAYVDVPIPYFSDNCCDNGEPPMSSGEDCESAIDITLLVPGVFNTGDFTGETQPACVGGNSKYFVFTAPESEGGSLYISSCGYTDDGTPLALYSGPCENGLVELLCSSAICSPVGNRSVPGPTEESYTISPGETVYIVWSDSYGAEAHDFLVEFYFEGNKMAEGEASRMGDMPQVGCTLTNTFNGEEDASGFYPVGETEVTYLVDDGNGNSTECTFFVTVNDTDDPVLTCPESIIVNNDEGMCGAYVDVPIPYFSDNCCDNGEPPMSSGEDCESAIDITLLVPGVFNTGDFTGETQPACVGGNSKYFVFTAPESEGGSLYISSCGYTDDGTPLALYSGPCENGLVELLCSSANCSPVGNRSVPGPTEESYTISPGETVYIVWSDSYGAEAHDFFVGFFFEGNKMAEGEASRMGGMPQVGCTLTNTFNGEEDASGFYPVGETEVTYLVDDGNGNSTECTFFVTVNDTDDPVITCPESIIVNNDEGMCGAYVDVPIPYFSDNCCDNGEPPMSSGEDCESAIDITLLVPGVFNTGDFTGETQPACEGGNSKYFVFTAPESEGGSLYISSCGYTDDGTPLALYSGPCENGLVELLCSSAICSPVGNRSVPGPTEESYTISPGETVYIVWSDSYGAEAHDFLVEFYFEGNKMAEGEASRMGDMPQVGCTLTNTFNGEEDASGFYPVGETEVTYLVDDGNGNSTECTFFVTVNDTDDPVITCPESIIVNNDEGMCGAYVDVPIPYFSDNCCDNGEPPMSSGEDCESAIDITLLVPGVFNTGDFTGETQPACVGGNSKYFVFTAPESEGGSLYISSCGYTDDGTPLALYSGPCENGLVELLCSSAICSPVGNRSVPGPTEESYTISPGETVYIVWSDSYGAEAHDFFVGFFFEGNKMAEGEASRMGDMPQVGCTLTNTFNGEEDASGFYPIGTTTVNYVATDLSGNTATCSQTVIVEDSDLSCTPDFCSDPCIIDLQNDGVGFNPSPFTDANGSTGSDIDIVVASSPTLLGFDVDVLSDGKGCTKTTGDMDDFTMDFEIESFFDVYGGNTLTTVPSDGSSGRWIRHDGTGFKGQNVNGNINDNQTSTGDVSCYNVKVLFTTPQNAIDVNVGMTSINTAGESFESTSVIFLDETGTPYGSASYNGFWDGTPQGTNGGSNTSAVNTEADIYTVSGSGVWTAADPITVDVTDPLNPVANSNGPNNNAGINASIDALLGAGVQVGGFIFRVCLEDVATTSTEDARTTSRTNFTSTLNDFSVCTPVLCDPPALAASPVDEMCLGSVDGSVTITATGTGTFTYSLDGGANVQPENEFTGLAAGPYTATVIVDDDEDCTATVDFTIGTTADVTPPTITCSDPVIVNNDQGECEADVTVISPTVTDNCTSLGSALNFDGTEHVDISNTCIPASVVDDFTMEFWVRPASGTEIANLSESTTGASAQNQGPYAIYDTYGQAWNGCPNRGAGIQVGTNGVIVAEHTCGTVAPVLVYFSTGSISSTCWTHISVVYTAREPSLYINGVLIKTGLTGPDPVHPGGCNNQNGGIGGGHHGHFTGDLDEVRVWDFSRSPSEILGDYQASLTGSESGLILYYNFDEGTGSTVAANSGYGGSQHDGDLLPLMEPASDWIYPGALSISAINDYNNTCDASDTYPVGTTTVTWTATDASGNGTTCTQTVTVNDNEPPTITCPADVTTGLDCNTMSLPMAETTLSGTDNCGATSFIVAGTVDEALPTSFCSTDDRTITRTYSAVDASGNTGTCVQNFTFDADVTPPVLTCPADVTTLTCGQALPDAVTSLSGADNCDPATSYAVTYADVSNNANGCLGTPLIIQRTYSALDACGNTGTCVQTFTYVVDVTPPLLTCPADVTTLTCGQPLPEAVSTLEGTDNCDPATSYDVTFADASNNADGCPGTPLIIQRTYSAVDGCGNTGTCVQTFTYVVDDIDPEITACPDDETLTLDGSCEVSLPDYTSFTTATDNCTASPTITQSPEEGTILSGHGTVQLVTMKATDECGNSSTCSFEVTLDDDENPTIECSGNLTGTTDNDQLGNCFGLVSGLTPIVDDNCGITNQTWALTGATENSSPLIGVYSTEFQTFNVGETLVTYEVEDAAGNPASCSFTVTVTDNEPPSITCPADITVDNDAGECGAIVTYATPTISDNCPGGTVSCSPESGTIFPLGSTLITCTAADASDNEVTCSFTVTVSDTESPVIECPTVDPVNNDPGMCGAIVNIPIPLLSDNCCEEEQIHVIRQDPRVAQQTKKTEKHEAASSFTMKSAHTALGISTGAGSEFLELDPNSPLNNVISSLSVDIWGGDYHDGVFYGYEPFNGNLHSFDEAGTRTLIGSATQPVGQNQGLAYNEANDMWYSVESNCGFNSRLYEVNINTGAKTLIGNMGEVQCAIWLAIDHVGNAYCADPTDDNLYSVDLSIGSTSLVGPSNINIATLTQDADFSIIDNKLYAAAARAQSGNNFGEYYEVNTFTGEFILLGAIPENRIITAFAMLGDHLTVCSSVSLSNDRNDTEDASGFYPVGETEVTYTVDDGNGNSTMCTFIVTVSDNEPPTLECPAQADLIADPFDCSVDTSPANTGIATAEDNCDDAPEISFTDESTQTFDGSSTDHCYEIIRTWTAEDDAGNGTSCTQTITVTDNTAPAWTTETGALDMTIECSDDQALSDAQSVFPAAQDNCDPDVSDIVKVSGEPEAIDDCPQVGVIVNTWTVIDACGNTSSTYTQTITLIDTTAPEISCPGEVHVNDGSSILPPATGEATATDNCDPAPEVTYDDVLVSGGCEGEGEITRVWKAEDACGNTAFCLQTITFTDNIAPLILCPNDTTVSCGSSLSPEFMGEPEVLGGSDALVDISFTEFIEQTSNGSCTDFTYLHARVWYAEDDCGNSVFCKQFINVVDTTPPVMTCPELLFVDSTSGLPEPDFAGGSTSDNCDGAVSVTHVSDVSDGQSEPETVTRTYLATDACGNTTECSHLIIIDDVTPPMITCPEPVSVICIEDVPAPDVDLVVTTSDCGATVTYVGDVSDGETCPETITRTYLATDECGNSITCTQTITVHDMTPPTMTCPAAVNVDCSEAIPAPDFEGGSTDDNCAAEVAVSHVSDVSDNNFNPETITRTYRATDACGNTVECTQTITILDTEAPTFDCPADEVVSNDPGECGAFVEIAIPDVLDNCCSLEVAPESIAPPHDDADLKAAQAANEARVAAMRAASVSSGTAERMIFTDEMIDKIGTSKTSINTASMKLGGGCPNPISDPSFEAGAFGGIWTEFSTNFGTVLCDPIGCGPALALTGDWYAWFGGAGAIFEEGSVSQVVTIPSDALTLDVPMATGFIGSTTDFFEVLIDGTAVLTVLGSEGVGAYVLYSIDITAYAGGTHTIDFHSITNEGESFIMDDVDIICPGSQACTLILTNDHTGTDDASGFYPVGETTVTYTAQESNGNSTVCSFTVTVNDTEGLVIVCPEPISVVAAPGACTAVVTYETPVGTENCEGTSTQQIEGRTSGDEFEVGVTLNTFLVIDANGNTALCDFTVTVLEDEAPYFEEYTDYYEVPFDADLCGAEVALETPPAFDNCGPVTVVNDYNGTSNGLDVYPAGEETLVTWTATDASGNTSTTTTTVKVGKLKAASNLRVVCREGQGTFKLKWDLAPGAQRYRAQVRNLLGTIVLDKQMWNPGANAFGPLPNDTVPAGNYQWRVISYCKMDDAPNLPGWQEYAKRFTSWQPITLPCTNQAALPFDDSSQSIKLLSTDVNAYVYPNPTEGIFYLDTDMEDYTLEVYDLKGQMVYNETRMKTGITELDLQEAPNGMYLLKMYNNSAIMTKRITIQR